MRACIQSPEPVRTVGHVVSACDPSAGGAGSWASLASHPDFLPLSTLQTNERLSGKARLVAPEEWHQRWLPHMETQPHSMQPPTTTHMYTQSYNHNHTHTTHTCNHIPTMYIHINHVCTAFIFAKSSETQDETTKICTRNSYFPVPKHFILRNGLKTENS